MDSPQEIISSLSSPLEPIVTSTHKSVPQWDGIKAIIFDIYGTLFISGSGDISLAQENTQEEAFLKSLETYQFRSQTKSYSFTQSFHQEIKAHQSLENDQGADYPEVDIREVWQSFLKKEMDAGHIQKRSVNTKTISNLALYYECLVNPVWPMPKLEKTLKELSSSPLSLGIVSNAQFYTPELFKAFLGKSYLEMGFSESLCIWSYQERRGKPSPLLFDQLLNALKKQGIRPDESIYVGNDMRNDIWTAKEAGLKTLLFAGDKRSLRLRREDSRNSKILPDGIITELQDIVSVSKILG